MTTWPMLLYSTFKTLNIFPEREARVYVERTIGRVKGFRLLQKVIPKSLVPIISQLIFVAAMLVNFQEPLVNK